MQYRNLLRVAAWCLATIAAQTQAQQVFVVPADQKQSAKASEAPSAKTPEQKTDPAAGAAKPAVIPDRNTPAPAIVSKPKPKFDPAKVHPDVAVKKTPKTEVSMPGVMDLPGAKAVLNANERTVEATPNSTHVVYLSKNDSNLLVTPFPNAVVITTENCLKSPEKKSFGNKLIVSVADPATKSCQAWVTDADDNSSMIGINVVPKNDVSSQVVTFVLKGTVDTAASQDGLLGNKNDPLVAGLSDRLGKLAQGKKLQGYAIEDVSKLPAVSKNGLIIKPVLRHSSNRDDIWEYRVTNASNTVALVSKADFCNGPRGECPSEVIAVSIFPKDSLPPGGEASAFVDVTKSKVQ